MGYVFRQSVVAQLSGGGAPAAGRPWRILLVVRGFSSKSDALAFEWAWQKPHTSRHIARQWGVKGFGKCGTRSKVSVRLAALALLLVHGHWAACALHVRVCAPEECGQALQDAPRRRGAHSRADRREAGCLTYTEEESS